ncbi:hypothetical protein [Chromobacterium sphagni]|nr:hypothetical protein [Chromobacterium sphagni]
MNDPEHKVEITSGESLLADESYIAGGDFEGLICLVQMRYGLTREEAENQVKAFLDECGG